MRRLISLLSVSALLATMAVATVAAPVAATTPAGTVIFDNTAAVLPSNLPSFGPEAYYFNEWGGGAIFAGTARNLNTATVTMSSWACETGSWTDGTCLTTLGATYSAEITFNVYDVSGASAVGSLLATRTQTFQIPFRPSYDSTNCAASAGQPGLWFDGATCKNGKAVNVTFTFSGQMLPDNAIFGIAYNTDTNGYTPLGGSGSPLDSLNIAVYPAAGTAAPSVGSWLSTETYTSTNLPFVAFSGPRSGTFAEGYQPAVQITALPSCTPTGFKGLTAALIDPIGTVTGTVDARTCNIGVYYSPGSSGTVTAEVFGANYYGVVANKAAVNVTNSTIHHIGESPFDGSQHGVGVLYTTRNDDETSNGSTSGTLSGTTITNYQKNGVVVSGAGAKVTVKNNVVTGQGKIAYIAQNGIQVSYGASGIVTGNTVTGNWYTPTSYTACGLLLYQAAGVKQSGNALSANEMNLCNYGRGGGNVRP